MREMSGKMSPVSLICHKEGTDDVCQYGEVKPCITDHYQPVNNHINPGRKRGATVFKDSPGIKMKTLIIIIIIIVIIKIISFIFYSEKSKKLT